MSIVSFEFLVLVLASIAVYYILPSRFRWMLLVLYTIGFFYLSSNPWTSVYLLANILITYGTTMGIVKAKEQEKDGKAKLLLIVGIVGNAGILAALKYSNFVIDNLNSVFRIAGSNTAIANVDWIAPLGISFYSVVSLGYLLDCYWGIAEAQKNPLKTALFISYFPQLTSGPITRYSDVKDSLFKGGRFGYKTITFGFQRILWGFFKKLVISARLGIIVDGIYSNVDIYNGFYIWIAAGAFMLQLYTDFSGCMDIILGVSECYGIKLPENFRTPFFSTTVQEYWQRWHITLGAWLKDYILYPVLRAKWMTRFTKWLKKKFGKKASRQISSYLAMLIVWLIIGLWHGGAWKYILGEGLWFWACIVLNQVLQPLYKKLIAILRINVNNFSWHFFMSVKVFILASIGNMFFRLDGLKAAIHAMKQGINNFNPWIFFNGSLLQFGVSWEDINIIIFGLLLLIIVGVIQEKNKSAREWMAEQGLVFRWLIWLGMIAFVIIYGMYGPGYSAAEFIYRGF